MPLKERIEFSIKEIDRILEENGFTARFETYSEADKHAMASGDLEGQFDPEDVEQFEIYNFLTLDLENLQQVQAKLNLKEQVDESSLFELMMNVQDDIILSD